MNQQQQPATPTDGGDLLSGDEIDRLIPGQDDKPAPGDAKGDAPPPNCAIYTDGSKVPGEE